MDESSWDNKADGHFRALDSLVDWEQRFKKVGRRAPAKLRLIIEPSVDFQVISALWISKVGFRFDAAIDPDLSFANRLRTTPGSDRKALREANLETAAIFEPYFSGYRRWRQRGLESIEESLRSGRDILALTMDIEQFYHRVNPEFIVRRSFLKKVGITLSDRELLFTNQLLGAISTWYKATPDFKMRPEGAIPVGLSASKIIANVLLTEFDRLAKASLRPIYYGRYVDDIFLVLSNREHLYGAKEVARWISRELGHILSLDGDHEGPPSFKLNLSYARDSELIFRGHKQKIFALSSADGLDLVQHIKEQIREHSSEYRLLPVLPESGSAMASKALLATPDAKLAVDALRKADVVSVRRLGFALLLGDMELLSFDLQPRSWTSARQDFYGLVNRHAITPAGFFEFANYLPRVFGLMIACSDFGAARALVRRLARLIRLLRSTTSLGQRSQASQFDLCLRHTADALKQAAIQAATRRTSAIDDRLLSSLRALRTISRNVDLPSSGLLLQGLVREVLLADWGSRPYKHYWYFEQANDEPGPPIPEDRQVRRRIRIGGIRAFRKLSKSLKVPHWPALAFPTRPLKVDEISLVAPEVLSNNRLYRRMIMILRGAKVADTSPVGFLAHDPSRGPAEYFAVPGGKQGDALVAVTSFSVTDRQWELAAVNRSDRSFTRYMNLNRIVNRILQEHPRPNYIIFPELSIPMVWSLRIARKLAANGVSLLAGVEYHRDKQTRKLRNDALVSLTTHWPGYRSHIVFLQSKFAPAHEELKQLRRKLKKVDPLFIPTGRSAQPVVYVHGRHCFSLLICSDLTDVTHRNALRGHIDTLFVLEWNRDTKSFSSLVESAALDLHAYIAQVNNRRFGDSRVRSPADKDYYRDLVQVKGGESDFYVIGLIDFHSLRKEQRAKLPSSFKPTPIGYQMSELRKR